MKKKVVKISNTAVFYACPYCLPHQKARLVEVKLMEASCEHKKGFFDKNKECRENAFECKKVLKCEKCKETFAYSKGFLKKQKRKYKDG